MQPKSPIHVFKFPGFCALNIDENDEVTTPPKSFVLNTMFTMASVSGRGSERRKSLHQKSKKEHRKSNTSLLDQNVESLTSTVIKIKNYLWHFHPMSLG